MSNQSNGNGGTAASSTSRRGSNLTNEDRSRGGQRSAQMQQRDQYGHFIGSAAKGTRGGSEATRTGGSRGPEAIAGRSTNTDE